MKGGIEKEFWKDIPGFEDYYQASNLGRIRSLDRIVEYHRNNKIVKYYKKGRILKLSKSGNGYMTVSFPICNQTKTMHVHFLVAKTFLPNVLNKPTVNHINEIRTDNRVSNLEWATYKEQMNYGTLKKRLSKTMSEKIGVNSVKYKPSSYYSEKPTTRTDFKRICKKYGWSFKEFKEVWLGDYRNTRREKKYYYYKISGMAK